MGDLLWGPAVLLDGTLGGVTRLGMRLRQGAAEVGGDGVGVVWVTHLAGHHPARGLLGLVHWKKDRY